MTFDFPEIKLGLELEVIDFGSSKIEYPNSVWTRKIDGSLDWGGREYVSRPLIGNEVVHQVNEICSSFKDVNCRVNNSCGFHVHADFDDARYESFLKLYKVCKTIYPIFTQLFPDRVNNQYCIEFDSCTDSFLNKTSYSGAISHIDSRYYWVNFHSYGKHGTIENRFHPGTINANDILTWSEMWAKLCFGVRQGKLKDMRVFSETTDCQEEIIDKIELTKPSKDRLLNGYSLYKQSLMSLVK